MGKTIISGGAGGVGSDECTATKDKVLAGYKAVTADSDDEAAAGTMPNNGAQNATLNCGQSKTIPAGYTTGGTVTANSLAGQTSGTATAAQILSGQTAWVNGGKVTGTMPNRGTGVHSTSAGINSSGLFYYVPRGYYYEGTGDGWIYRTKAEAAYTIGLTAEKLMKGQTVLDIAGAATSDANATTTHILSGKTAYVNGSKITGTIPNRGSVDNNGYFGWNDPVGNRAFIRLHEGYYIPYSNGDLPATCVQYPSLAAGIGLTANKIIKGQTVLGITGTAEGYYPDPTDLYYKGSNPAGFAWTIGFTPEATQFTFTYLEAGFRSLVFGVDYDVKGFTKLNIGGSFKKSFTATNIRIDLFPPGGTTSSERIATWYSDTQTVVTHAELDITQVISIPKGYLITFKGMVEAGSAKEYYIDHIWFS